MIAIFASTPMHILRTLQMKLHFSDYTDDADLFLPYNNFVNFSDIVANLKKTGLFHKIYVYHPEEWNKQARGATFRLVMLPNKYRKFFKENDYDAITSFSITNILVTLCYHEQNKKGIRVNYTGVEDNPSIMKMELPHKESEAHFWCRLVGLETPFYCMDKYYLSAPDYFKDRIQNPVVSMPPISLEDEELKNVANAVFAFSPEADIYDADILLMESSFNVDNMFIKGSENKEYQFFEDIKNRYPNKKILVKTHPRTPANRFEGIGFTIIQNSQIPWQLFMLNMGVECMDNKIMIGIISSTLQSNKLLFDYEMKCVCLAKCFKDDVVSQDGGLWIDDAQIKKYEYLKSIYSDENKFLIPADRTEVFESIDRLLA